jgi:hypothetical protein
MVSYIIFCLGISLVGCNSVKIDPNGKTKILEGTWTNNNFTLVIKGNYYISLNNSVLYRRGQITYDGEHFIYWHQRMHRETMNGILLLKQ